MKWWIGLLTTYSGQSLSIQQLSSKVSVALLELSGRAPAAHRSVAASTEIADPHSMQNTNSISDLHCSDQGSANVRTLLNGEIKIWEESRPVVKQAMQSISNQKIEDNSVQQSNRLQAGHTLGWTSTSGTAFTTAPNGLYPWQYTLQQSKV